jgi:hypothetical protein
MKTAAAEAGIDPALVERAARLLPVGDSAASSFLVRLMGGELQLRNEAHFSTVLSEAEAATLLSAVRVEVGPAGDGHSGPSGMTWHAANGFDTLRVTSRPDQDGTTVEVVLHRGGALALTGMAAVAGSVLTGMVGIFGVGPEFGPAVGVSVVLSGISAALALARSYWASSTRTARERIGRTIDCVDYSIKAISDARDA